MSAWEASVMLTTQQKQCSKQINFYCNSVSQSMARARQVLQALPVHLEPKEPEDDEGRKEGQETREIKALWDRQVKAANKALWDLQALRETLESRDRKER